MLVSNNFLIRKVFGSLQSFLVKVGLSRVPRNVQTVFNRAVHADKQSISSLVLQNRWSWFSFILLRTLLVGVVWSRFFYCL